MDLLDPAPDARLLEIGCGPGAAAELICARLTAGHLLAVDRSAIAVERTRTRNAACIAAGRLDVRRSELSTLELAPTTLDGVLAVNVNLFWTRDAQDELLMLRPALAPSGTLLLVYEQPPHRRPGSADDLVDRVRTGLLAAGFAEPEVVVGATTTALRARVEQPASGSAAR